MVEGGDPKKKGEKRGLGDSDEEGRIGGVGGDIWFNYLTFNCLRAIKNDVEFHV